MQILIAILIKIYLYNFDIINSPSFYLLILINVYYIIIALINNNL